MRRVGCAGSFGRTVRVRYQDEDNQDFLALVGAMEERNDVI